ncbi:hypothetical protein E2C01_100623 [Portunus trituberculatus]|uniref:Uncharacterized protein n=1 Tax=Portunus trituberculatus TaxID=210409 RepID=A0A5B7KCP0_PORTR|nr:hypothetical protein [Portunus trituberculatus]
MPGCRHQLSCALPHCRRLSQQWHAHSHESTQHYHIYILFKPLAAPTVIAAPKASPSQQRTLQRLTHPSESATLSPVPMLLLWNSSSSPYHLHNLIT